MLIPYEGGKFKVTQKYTYGKHNGLDIVGLSSKNLIAVADGVIYQSRMVTDKSNKTWEWGNYVTLKTDDGRLVVYAHMSQRKVQQGQRVKKGDVIGVEGNTGYSFGSHCHLEVRNLNNVVSNTANTPAYTGIPNIVQTINAESEDEPMTAAEKEAFNKLSEKVNTLNDLLKNKSAALDEADKKITELQKKLKVYHYWNEIKALGGDFYPALVALSEAGIYCHKADDLNINRIKLECCVQLARALKSKGLLKY